MSECRSFLIEGGIYGVLSGYDESSGFAGFAAGSRVEGVTAFLIDGVEKVAFPETSVVERLDSLITFPKGQEMWRNLRWKGSSLLGMHQISLVENQFTGGHGSHTGAEMESDESGSSG